MNKLNIYFIIKLCSDKFWFVFAWVHCLNVNVQKNVVCTTDAVSLLSIYIENSMIHYF